MAHPITEAKVEALELERVKTKIEVLFERDDKFYTTIKKGAEVEVISNRHMRIPLEIRPGGAFQYFNADGGDLGRGGGPTVDKALVRAVFLSENIEYTKLAEWSTNSDRKAITNGVRRLVATALDELRRQIDSQLMGSGNGVIGTVTSDTPAGGANVINLTTDGHGARLMRYGQVVQIFDETLATLRGAGVVTQWDVENKVISLTPQVAGVTGGDKIVTNGINNPAVPGEALFGVKYHHSNASVGEWLGFNRATTPEIRANRVNGGGVALALPSGRLAINKIGNRLGEGRNFRLRAWTHPAQKQAYESLGQLISTISKTPGNKSLDLYFDNMQIAGAPVETHHSWDPTRIDFITEGAWGRAEILPIGFYKSDGRNIFEIRGASGGVAAAEIFYMVNGMQTYLKNPAAVAYIDNLAVPAGY